MYKRQPQQLIHTLEQYCNVELDEKWLYELATLYNEVGMSDLCVRTCDKIMLMFGLGKYVDKAMELKIQHAPLTKYQMDLEENRDKYEARLRAVEQGYDCLLYTSRMVDQNVLSHAEIIAIRKACKKMGDWRLENCTLYVTLEPCPMCAGAIVQARVPQVVIGCMNPKAGCAGSVLDMLHEDGFNHQVETKIGVLGEELSLIHI